MGNNLFGANISGQIAAQVGNLLLPATLVKRTFGARPTDPTAGLTTTTTSYSCNGFIDEYTARERQAQTVQEDLRKVTLLGDTIAGGAVRPETGDQITIEGATFEIVGPIMRDPDAATYECSCRG